LSTGTFVDGGNTCQIKSNEGFSVAEYAETFFVCFGTSIETMDELKTDGQPKMKELI
jgi:hypothetical protein